MDGRRVAVSIRRSGPVVMRSRSTGAPGEAAVVVAIDGYISPLGRWKELFLTAPSPKPDSGSRSALREPDGEGTLSVAPGDLDLQILAGVPAPKRTKEPLHLIHRAVVDGDNDVSGLDARLRGRTAGNYV